MKIDPTSLRWMLWGAAAAFLMCAVVSALGATIILWWGFIIAAMLAGMFGLSVSAKTMAGGNAAPANAADPLAALLSPLAQAGFERLPDPVLLLNENNRVLFANAPMRSIVGVEPQGKHVSAIFRIPQVLDALKLSSDGEPAIAEFTIPVPVERHYQLHVAQISDRPRVTLLLLHDLTSERQSERMRADFVANASHELRTPLAAVTGFIETLKGHAKDDSAAREKFLDIMSVEAARMRRLIDDLLSLTRIEQNEHVPPSGRSALDEILREAAAALTPLARAEKVAIEIKAVADLPPVVGQRDELMQLFQNLIHNAIKYGKPGGHVWIEAAPADARDSHGPMVMASIRDDGEGIPTAAIPRLTERFYRVDVKRSREKGGTGLGLAIVKHIVNRHKGRLLIESEVGQGSKFKVFLPVAQAPDAVT